MKILLLLVAAVSILPTPVTVTAAEVKVSEATQACIECHRVVHPGIVADWQRSRHAATTPARALGVEGLGRKVSSSSV
nr:hydroxylamine oxidase [Desulfobacterales bacterium]